MIPPHSPPLRARRPLGRCPRAGWALLPAVFRRIVEEAAARCSTRQSSRAQALHVAPEGRAGGDYPFNQPYKDTYTEDPRGVIPSNPAARRRRAPACARPGRAAGCPAASTPRSGSSARRTRGSGRSSRGAGSPRETYRAQTGQTTYTGARSGSGLDNPGGRAAPARGGALGLHHHLARDHLQGTARRQASKKRLPSGPTACARKKHEKSLKTMINQKKLCLPR